jgi:uncharacterized protein (DUF1499 family)
MYTEPTFSCCVHEQSRRVTYGVGSAHYCDDRKKIIKLINELASLPAMHVVSTRWDSVRSWFYERIMCR